MMADWSWSWRRNVLYFILQKGRVKRRKRSKLTGAKWLNSQRFVWIKPHRHRWCHCTCMLPSKLASQLMYTPLSSDDENLSDRTQAPMFTDEVMFNVLFFLNLVLFFHEVVVATRWKAMLPWVKLFILSSLVPPLQYLFQTNCWC